MRLCIGHLKTFSEEDMLFGKQLGIDSVQFNTPIDADGNYLLSYEALFDLKTRCADYGMKLETIENVPIGYYDKVMLGLPGRDEQIERYIQLIRDIGRAGIPSLGYHFVPTFVWRTSYETNGRGGALVSSFHVGLESEGNKVNYPARLDVEVPDVETMWDNYTYFMKAVLPVAEQANVKLALHPDDPPIKSIAGVARLFINYEAFLRAETIATGSPAWGLDLCLGCCSEMLGGKDNVFRMIKHFGPKKKIFYIHFRDVKGTIPDFEECFLGEGNFNPAEVIEALYNVEFDGYIMDDHVPKIVNDSPYGHRARAYELGKLQGLIAMYEYLKRT